MSRYQFPQQPIADDTLLGNSSGSAALPIAQSVADVRTMLAISNVDNTSDLNKPVSIATQEALDSRLRVCGIYFDGQPSNPLICAYNAAMNTTDVMYRVRIRPVATAGGQVQLLAERLASGQQSWQSQLNANGTIGFWFSTSGSSLAVLANSSVALPRELDGKLIDIAVTFDSNNGSGNYEVKFWYASPETELAEWGTWTQLGTTVTGSTLTIFSGTAAFRLGSFAINTSNNYMGEIFRAELWNAINPDGANGTCIAATQTHGSPTRFRFASPTIVDGFGRTWTVTGNNWSFRSSIVSDTQYPLFVYEGDSITAGVGTFSIGNTWWAQAERLRTGLNRNLVRAVASRQIGNAIAENATTVDPFYDGPNNYLFGWLGTNDLYFGSSAATVITRIQDWATERNAVGWKVVLFTILPRSNAGTPVTFEADRQTVNTWLRDNWATYGVALVDVGANSVIGDVGDQTNTTYYGDLVHLTPAGQTIVAGLVNAQLSALGMR